MKRTDFVGRVDQIDGDVLTKDLLSHLVDGKLKEALKFLPPGSDIHWLAPEIALIGKLLFHGVSLYTFHATFGQRLLGIKFKVW